MTEKPKTKTRAQLEKELADVTEELTSFREVHRNCREQLAAQTNLCGRMRGQLDDLKKRLAEAEAETQRMRGYIARVQEDDVVREDLVKVGDPDGAHQLVPKRKPTAFHQPNPYAADGGMTATDYDHRPRSTPRHWVTY